MQHLIKTTAEIELKIVVVYAHFLGIRATVGELFFS